MASCCFEMNGKTQDWKGISIMCVCVRVSVGECECVYVCGRDREREKVSKMSAAFNISFSQEVSQFRRKSWRQKKIGQTYRWRSVDDVDAVDDVADVDDVDHVDANCDTWFLIGGFLVLTSVSKEVSVQALFSFSPFSHQGLSFLPREVPSEEAISARNSSCWWSTGQENF